ncbi:E3 ubiquitin-protein ligase TRIM17-like [Lissotriton helveticus]
MAAPLSDLQSEVSCPVCFEYFTDPVTIECGHSYCRGCITLSWGRAGGTRTCPQCRTECTRTDLPRNVQLSNLAEITQRMTSVELCERHREPLKLFCEEDQAAVCTICDRSREHRGHAVTPIEEAAEQYQLEFTSTLEHLQKELDNIVGLQANAKKKSAEFTSKIKDERERMEMEFQELQEFLEKEKIHFLSKLDKEEKEILHMLNEYITKLSEHTSSLNEMITKIQEKRKLSLVQQLKDVKGFLSRFKSDTTMKPVQVSTELSDSIYNLTKELVLMKMSAKYNGACDVSGGPGVEELRIVLFDLTGDGTHAALDTLLGRERELEYRAKMGECTRRSCVRDGRRLLVTEFALPPDLEDIKKEECTVERMKLVTFSAPGPHAIIFALGVGQSTTKGLETTFFFKEGHRGHALVVFTGKEGLGGRTIKSHIQGSGTALKGLVERFGGRYCAISSCARGGAKARERAEVMTLIDAVLRLQGGAFYTQEIYQEVETHLLEAAEVVKERYREEAKLEEEATERQCEDIIKDLEGERESAEKTKLIQEVRREMRRKLRESERKYHIKLEGAREGAAVGLAVGAAEERKQWSKLAKKK